MARWVRMVAMLAMAALIASSQCDALCLASLCQTTSAKSTDGCHHSKKDNSGCHYRQSNSAGVEASSDLAQIPVAPLPAIAADLPACSFLVMFGQGYPKALERGYPPGKTSILRI